MCCRREVLFNGIPWVDETGRDDKIKVVPNTMSSDSLWMKIEGDFKKARDLLPTTQPGQPGRANRLSAEAYLAKAYLYHAYTQDGSYTVTGIKASSLASVVILTIDWINSGQTS